MASPNLFKLSLSAGRGAEYSCSMNRGHSLTHSTTWVAKRVLTPLVSLFALATVGCARPPQKADSVPLGTVSIKDIDMTFSIDAGKLSHDAGNKRILLLFPKPSNGSHQVIEVTSATLDGQNFIEDSNEKFGRTVLRTWATPESGMAVVKVHAKVFNRRITEDLVLSGLAELDEKEKEKYLNNQAPFPYGRQEFRGALESAGLVIHSGQSVYDFMKKTVAGYMVGRFHYQADPKYSADVYKRPEKLIESPGCDYFKCNFGSMLWVAIARANGIAARETPMVLLGRNGDSTNHSGLEFFDPNHGWVPVDASLMLHTGNERNPNWKSEFGSDTSADSIGQLAGSNLQGVILMDGVQWKYTTPMNSVANLPYVQGAFSYIAEDRSSGKAGIIPDVRFSMRNLPMGH